MSGFVVFNPFLIHYHQNLSIIVGVFSFHFLLGDLKHNCNMLMGVKLMETES